MRRREALGFMGIVAAAGMEAAPSVRDRFVGVYKLIKYTRKSQSGEVVDVYGPNPVGRISYDRAGRMFALLMRPDRKPAKDPRAVTLEEYREMQSGFVAYCGNFDVDEGAKIVVHHVQAASNPAWVGTDFKRIYEFSKNRLTLKIAGAADATLVWEREAD